MSVNVSPHNATCLTKSTQKQAKSTLYTNLSTYNIFDSLSRLYKAKLTDDCVA